MASADRPGERPSVEITHFLEQVRTFLEHAHVKRDWYSEELYADLAKAWAELQPAFERARSALRGEGMDEELRRRGHFGAGLRLKLRGALRAIERFIPSRTRPLFLSAARWVDVLLGSLTFIPGVEAIKEFKEALEAAHLEQDDSEQRGT